MDILGQIFLSETDNRLTTKIKNMWYQHCFEEEIENVFGEKVFVMRGENPSTISLSIQKELWKEEKIKVSLSKIKYLQPT